MSRTLFALAFLLAAATAAPVTPGSDLVPEEEHTLTLIQGESKAAVLSQAQNANDFSEDSNADFEKMIGGPAAQGSEKTNAEAAEKSADMADDDDLPDIPPPVRASTHDWKEPAAGKPEFKYEFQPEFRNLANPPPVTGSRSSYLDKAGNAKEAQVQAEDKEIAAEEQAAALKQAEADSEKAREVQALQQQKNEVETLMNTAAAGAAAYKTAKEFHDKEVTLVHEAEAAEAAQLKTVHEAMATLKHQKDILARKKKDTAHAKGDEMHARFKAEFKGHQYTKARDAAVKADNDYRQTEHEEAKKQKFREVAEKAVAKEAQREAAEEAQDAEEEGEAISGHDHDHDEHDHEDGAVGAVVHEDQHKDDHKAAKQEGSDGCSDCSELPDIYSNAGGSCDDCAEWAHKGQCDLDAYKDFMSRYCAKSCGCKLAAPAAVTSLVAMPPKLKRH